jgi:FKBP-type peptidyl-prolyl cis-trans isomerase
VKAFATHSLKLFTVLAAALLITGCGGSSTPAPTGGDFSSPAGPEVTLDGGLKVQDFVIGTGAEAVVGSRVEVHYTGKLENGTVFDSSIGKATLPFQVGARGMIAGFDLGVRGMKVGGKRKVTIPPALGYGAQANGPIPANSTLLFEIELVSVK